MEEMKRGRGRPRATYRDSCLLIIQREEGIDDCRVARQRTGYCGKCCYKCGWNADEAKRRRKIIRTHGLTLDRKTGLLRLVVSRKEPLI